MTYIVRRDCIRRHWGGCSDGGRAVPGTSRCRTHASGWDKYKAQHPERAAQYRDHSWKLRRDAQLAKQPLCELRLPGCRGKATDADHVTPVSLGGDFAGPLRSMCRPCHLKVTAEASKESKRRAAERNRMHGPWIA
jgi:5-methylcytosine-specific restriction endonuclease McrA